MSKTVRLHIIAKTKASRAEVSQLTDSVYEVAVAAHPVGGKANFAIILALAKHFGLKPSHVTLISGHRTRNKLIELEFPA